MRPRAWRRGGCQYTANTLLSVVAALDMSLLGIADGFPRSREDGPRR
jgi:hypothetical protein